MPVSVFDIDGCLADTLHLVRWSYISAGADATDEDVRRPWHEWLPYKVDDVPEVRRRKADIYLALLGSAPVRRLPAGDLADELVRAGERVLAVSSASPRVTPAVMRSVGLEHVPLVTVEVRPHQRPTFLRLCDATGTYYDDDAVTVAAVVAQTDWTAIRV